MEKASRSIENLSDQIIGYSEEIGNAVEKISEKFGVSNESAISIVQTAIENMKLDVSHHKNYHLELIADALNNCAAAIEEISENI